MAAIGLGPWIAIASLIFTIGISFHGIAMRVRDRRLGEMKDRLEHFEAAHNVCQRELAAARSWMWWAQNNLMVKPGASSPPPMYVSGPD